jgi:hypothetical protein
VSFDTAYSLSAENVFPSVCAPLTLLESALEIVSPIGAYGIGA